MKKKNYEKVMRISEKVIRSHKKIMKKSRENHEKIYYSTKVANKSRHACSCLFKKQSVISLKGGGQTMVAF